MTYIKDPMEIEKRSFEIITKELGNKSFSDREGKIIKRMIHTSADFEYADITKIHPKAIDSALDALRKGCRIYTDTKMAMAGINKTTLQKYNSEVYCLVDDLEVSVEAKEKGLTRSMIGIERAIKDTRTKIFVVGNAPTALFILCEAISKNIAEPAVVIGVPVGFVGAAESKEELFNLDTPYITTMGRKGGSTIAASIVNALLYML